MSRRKLTITVLVVLAALALWFAQRTHDARLLEASARLDSVRVQLAVAHQEALAAAAAARTAQRRAVVERARADHAAESGAQLLQRAREWLAARPPTDTCSTDAARTAIAAADSLLKAHQIDSTTIDSLTAALASAEGALLRNARAFDESGARVARAAETVRRTVSPSWFTRILPQVTLGVGYGIDPTTLRPTSIVGAQIGWRIFP